jgi:hypothetical protein
VTTVDHMVLPLRRDQHAKIQTHLNFTFYVHSLSCLIQKYKHFCFLFFISDVSIKIKIFLKFRPKSFTKMPNVCQFYLLLTKLDSQHFRNTVLRTAIHFLKRNFLLTKLGALVVCSLTVHSTIQPTVMCI